MRLEGYELSEIANKIIEESCTNFNCKDNVSIILVDVSKHFDDFRKSIQN